MDKPVSNILLFTRFHSKEKIPVIFFFLLMLFFEVACSDSGQTTQPLPSAAIKANISGEISLDYSAPGVINQDFTDSTLQLICSTVATINNSRYALGVFIFYVDKTEKIGTFIFSDKSTGHNSDYAVGSFEIGNGNNRRIFIADSGSVTITKIINNTVQGTFNFKATEKTGTATIYVLNGTMSFQ